MAFALPLSELWRQQGWKVKIRDRERAEPPHVTIIWRTSAWRLSLRSGAFLDRVPPPGQVPDGLLTEVQAAWKTLVTAWDEMYPENPVTAEGAD